MLVGSITPRSLRDQQQKHRGGPVTAQMLQPAAPLKPGNSKLDSHREQRVKQGQVKQPKPTSSSPDGKHAAKHINSGLPPPFWASPNASNSPRSYSNVQEGANSWVSPQQQGLQMVMRIHPHAAEKSFHCEQVAAVASPPFPATLLTPVPTSSCIRDTSSYPSSLVLTYHLTLRSFYRY